MVRHQGRRFDVGLAPTLPRSAQGHLCPGDVVRPPRVWLDRTADTVRVTEPARGGHFAPFEEPDPYAEELRTFFRPFLAAATA